jgi:acetoacetyl-CoA synthetase
MSTAVVEGTVLWEPPPARKQASTLQTYIDWLSARKQRSFSSYAALWAWSVDDIEGFWESIWEFFEVRAATPYTRVLPQRIMPGAQWFAGATLNYAEHVFRHAPADRPAIVFESETQPPRELAWAELERSVASIAAALHDLGVRRGDRVAAYLPNIPEAVVALLACASIGAIWSSCAPDMGSAGTIDRFAQIEPKLLFAVDGYIYGGKRFDHRPAVAELQAALPTLEHTIMIAYLDPAPDDAGLERVLWWNTLLSPQPSALSALEFEQVPFDHPLWVLYSSGTTGLPKPIVQGHGGILLEHLKSLALQLDIQEHDRFFWFTTTGWMMWNFLVGGLLIGCTILLYDGSPARPDIGALWSFAERSGMTFFGASAAYIAACMKAGIQPVTLYDLHCLKGIGSTGSPLPLEGFQWIYEQVKADVALASISGGTDLCTAFVGGCPLLPIYAGEIQCRSLGGAVRAFDEHGKAVIDHVGELVITAPMPSMPLYFWNDPDGQRHRESYFTLFPKVWRHGDWCKISSKGSVVIYGRSDATINRMGIRMGTSDIYRAVEALPEVVDSLIVDLERLGRASYMPLFVVLADGVPLDGALQMRIKDAIRTSISARLVPDAIFAVAELPRTLNGKKMELPIKKILLGTPAEHAANPDSMNNPHTLAYFVALAARLNAHNDAEQPGD